LVPGGQIDESPDSGAAIFPCGVELEGARSIADIRHKRLICAGECRTTLCRSYGVYAVVNQIAIIAWCGVVVLPGFHMFDLPSICLFPVWSRFSAATFAEDQAALTIVCAAPPSSLTAKSGPLIPLL